MTPHPRAAMIVTMVLLAPLCLAMQCAGEDVSGPFVVPLEAAAGEIVAGSIEERFAGRLSLDYGLRGASGAHDVELTVQAQTSGNPDLESCLRVAAPPPRVTRADPWDTVTPPPLGQRFPLVRPLDAAVRISLPGIIPPAGLVTFPAQRTTYRIVIEPDNTVLAVYDPSSNLIPPLVSTAPADCESASNVTVYELNDGDHVLAIYAGTDEVTLTISEACEARRTVERTCPGTSGPPITRTINAAPDDPAVGRVAAPELGVGDRIAFELTCLGPGACDSDAVLFAYIEQLDCRSDNDCNAGRTCTREGYCVRPDSGGCQQSPGQPSQAGAALLLAAVILTVMRRRRRHSDAPSRDPASRSALVAATALLVAAGFWLGGPREANAAGNRMAVFMQAGVATQQLRGDVAAVTSNSVGLSLRQGIRYRPVAFYLSLGSDAWLTTQEAPPLQRGMRTFDLGLGARLGSRLGAHGFAHRLRLEAAFEYGSFAINANPLGEWLGASRSSFQALGPGAALALMDIGPLFVEVQGQWRALLGAESRTSVVSLLFSVGIQGVVERPRAQRSID